MLKVIGLAIGFTVGCYVYELAAHRLLKRKFNWDAFARSVFFMSVGALVYHLSL